MQLGEYLGRIGYTRAPAADHATLVGLHRAHLAAIAYENLDLHLGRPVGLEVAAIYDKIVRRGRGGWCYEMNSLLAWALREIGFDLDMLGGAVAPQSETERQELDHMLLLVRLGEPWLLDVGFGNGFSEPLPLRVGSHRVGPYTFRLERDGDYWRFHNHEHGGPGVDFRDLPRQPADYRARCDWLQTSPESGFVRRTVCHRMREDHTILSLRGAVLTTIDARGPARQVVECEAAYAELLRDGFRLRLADDEIARLWASVWPAHLAWVAAGAP